MLYAGFTIEGSGDLRLYRPRMRKVISSDHDFITACKLGNVPIIRQHLVEDTAHVEDVTPDDLSPLFYAIDGGHEHAVEELLARGADSNQTFGKNGSSPLAWALYKRNEVMVRTLLRYGANIHHIARNGWSVLFYLWIDEKTIQPSCLMFLRMLQTADPDDLALVEQQLVGDDGYSLLNRAACSGTAEEVNFLVQKGADLSWKDEFDWGAPFDAVFGDKLENLQTLVQYYPNFLELRDVRGWTLLHVAAEFGYEDIVRYLLHQGADWQARSWKTNGHVTKDLIGVACTPAEAARSQSREREQRFLKIVEEILGMVC